VQNEYGEALEGKAQLAQAVYLDGCAPGDTVPRRLGPPPPLGRAFAVKGLANVPLREAAWVNSLAWLYGSGRHRR
jgi:hypothetical protein